MEITDLAAVLERINTIFVDHGLLAATDRLLNALEQIMSATKGGDPAITITAPRAALLATHKRVDPIIHQWTPDQLTVLEQYRGRHLIGQPAIDTINQAFVDHFMNPAAVHAVITTIRDESAQLHTRAQTMLADLEPMLERTVVIVDGDENQNNFHETDRTVIQLIRDKLVPVNPTHSPAIPTRAKVMAAVPVALAVAGKAVDLYLRYNNKSNSNNNQPEPKQLSRPTQSNMGRTHVYSRRITIIDQEHTR